MFSFHTERFLDSLLTWPTQLDRESGAQAHIRLLLPKGLQKVSEWHMSRAKKPSLWTPSYTYAHTQHTPSANC